jgi:alpha-ketoglutarate-dependent taurine dioxygenase
MTFATTDKTSTTPAGLRYRPVHPAVGAEVLDLDISKPMSAEQRADLEALWIRHSVVLMRGQSFDEAQMVRFAQQYGECDLSIEDEVAGREHPEIMMISNVGQDGEVIPLDRNIKTYTLPQAWHSDGSVRMVPSYASMLHALEIPDAGGETCFAGMFAAYEALPEGLRAKIEGRHAVHYLGFTRLRAPELGPITTEQMLKFPPASHPVVVTHADGRKSIYIGENSYYIAGYPLEEGIRLHAELLSFVTSPQFVYEHNWQVGDFLIWDNRSTIHMVRGYDRRKRRVLKRTELIGTAAPV